MSDIDKKTADNSAEKGQKEEFKGYDLEQLRRHIALAAVRREFIREKTLNKSKAVRDKIPVLNGQSYFSSFGSKSILGKIIGGFNYLDYILIGISTFQAGKKIFSLFRRK